MKKKLPLDPFDWRTPLSADYQVGNLAWGIFLIGLILGGVLIASADWASTFGWLKFAAGIAVVVAATYIARRLIKTI